MSKKTKRVQVGMTDEAYEAIRQRAREYGLTVSAYLYMCAVQQAKRDEQRPAVARLENYG